LKFLLLAEASGLGFHVAARKKGVFSDQYADSMEEPTFSTQSADSCRSQATAFSQLQTLDVSGKLRAIHFFRPGVG
jgi:hypothetical protein